MTVILDNRSCVWTVGIALALPRVSPWKLCPGWPSVPCARKLCSVLAQLENLPFTCSYHWDICSTRHAASIYKSHLPVFITGFLELSVSSESQAQSEKRKQRGPLEPAVPKRNQNFTLQGQNGFPSCKPQGPAGWLNKASRSCAACSVNGERKQLSIGHRAVCLAEQDPDSSRTLTLSIFPDGENQQVFYCLFVLGGVA